MSRAIELCIRLTISFSAECGRTSLNDPNSREGTIKPSDANLLAFARKQMQSSLLPGSSKVLNHL